MDTPPPQSTCCQLYTYLWTAASESKRVTGVHITTSTIEAGLQLTTVNRRFTQNTLGGGEKRNKVGRVFVFFLCNSSIYLSPQMQDRGSDLYHFSESQPNLCSCGEIVLA